MSNELRFHTVFCCPVSKEESTPGNPPVLLKCGHAICKACVKRISINMTRYDHFSSRFLRVLMGGTSGSLFCFVC